MAAADAVPLAPLGDPVVNGMTVVGAGLVYDPFDDVNIPTLPVPQADAQLVTIAMVTGAEMVLRIG